MRLQLAGQSLAIPSVGDRLSIQNAEHQVHVPSVSDPGLARFNGVIVNTGHPILFNFVLLGIDEILQRGAEQANLVRAERHSSASRCLMRRRKAIKRAKAG